MFHLTISKDPFHFLVCNLHVHMQSQRTTYYVQGAVRYVRIDVESSLVTLFPQFLDQRVGDGMKILVVLLQHLNVKSRIQHFSRLPPLISCTVKATLKRATQFYKHLILMESVREC